MSENTLGERLTEARKKSQLSQSELAKRLEIGEKTLRSYEKGKDVTVGLVKKIAKELNIDAYWLMTGEKREESQITVGNYLKDNKTVGTLVKDSTLNAYKKDLSNVDYQETLEHTYMITKISLEAGAGNGIENFEIEELGKVSLDKELFRYSVNPDSLRVIQVKGDSMEPTIADNSHVVIDQKETEKVDAIYAICLGGQVLIKRLQFNLDGTISIRSDNPKYKEQVFNPNENQVYLRIIGKKVLVIQ